MKIKRAKPRRMSQSSHKIRSILFRDAVAYPFRDASAENVADERREARRRLPSQATAGQWTSLGPTNISGRMTCAVTHPQNPDVIWAGAAGGGVWYSTDAGATWTPQWHDEDTLNVGALAIDPRNPDVLYCGTGEANLSADSYSGVGLYRTEDGGKTWHLHARATRRALPNRIGAIVIDPDDTKHIWLGGVGHNYPREPTSGMGGLYESRDGGKTWSRHGFVSSNEYRCHAIIIHPEKADTVYVTVTEQGAQNGIWRTTDAGANWEHLTTGLPEPSCMERTSLTIALSNPSVVYAISSSFKQEVLGVYRTSDGGNSWQAVHDRPASDPDTQGRAFHYWRGGSSTRYESQMEYANTIVVDPLNENHVLCGGIDLHLTTDGGDTWRLATRWDREPGSPGYAHADHHALLMPQGAPGRVYDLNDGGMDVSYNGGLTWRNRSAGLVTTMYYDLDVGQSNRNYFGGGTQDAGTPMTFTGSVDDHRDVSRGDGGWTLIDPRNENHIYVSIYNLTIFRWPHSDPRQISFENVSPMASEAERKAVWMCFIAMDPSNSSRLFTGSSRVWRTDNDGRSWVAVSPEFNDTITAIEVSRADSKYVYVGTRAGAIHLSRDGGRTWSGNLSGAAMPNFKISRLKTSPINAKHVIATVANSGISHVYRSRDAGLTWEDVDRGMLPDVPHNCIAIPSKHGTEVYVGNDAGVWVSPDFCESWHDLTGDLPNVEIVDLVYHDADDVLMAATYGRGLWQIEIR